MKLYQYWRSTTSYRVRAALNLKGLDYESVSVDLVAGEQLAAEYMVLNASKGVPALMLDDGKVLTQSMAIIEYLDAVAPDPRLIPADPLTRARVMAAAQAVAMDIHPVNNLRVVSELKSRFGATPEQARDWMCHWMREGFTALEAQLADDAAFAFADMPDIADLCVLAQVYNARRWGLDLAPFGKILRVESACLAIPEIAAAHPDKQPDAKVTV